MNPVKNFAFDEHLVRVLMRDDDPWFVAVDVCRCLGLKDAESACRKLDDDEKGPQTVRTLGGEQTVIVVCEGGLYKLAFTSRKPEAQKFTRWVTHDVLPAIRKTGRYEAERSETHPVPPRDGDQPSTWPLVQRLKCVDLANKIYGRERAKAMWRTLGLPPVPPPPPTPRDEARVCLRHLLDAAPHEGGPAMRELVAAALDDDEAARAMLLVAGVRPLPEAEGFLVANVNPRLERIYAGTDWERGRWSRVLRRLGGVEPHGPRTLGGRKTRSTFVPADYLDADAQVPATALH